MMTNEEIQELRKGDIIYVPFVVDEVKRSNVRCHIERTGDEEDFVFQACDIKAWERPRRKFRKGDVVVNSYNTISFVVEDEGPDGVALDYMPERSYNADDLTLVMTAEEYAERMGKKGGNDA